MRVADSAFDLDDFFQAGRRALVGRSSTRKSAVSRSSLMSVQSDPSPRQSMARMSSSSDNAGVDASKSSMSRLRQGMRISSDPFAAAGGSSSPIKVNGLSSKVLKQTSGRRSVLGVVDVNSNSDITGPSSPTAWTLQGSSAQKSRPELNAGLEARRMARLGKIQSRQQKGRYRGRSSAHEEDQTVRTLRGDELSFSTMGRSVAAENQGDEDESEDEERNNEEHEQEMPGRQSKAQPEHLGIGIDDVHADIETSRRSMLSRRASAKRRSSHLSDGQRDLRSEHDSVRDSDDGSDMSIEEAVTMQSDASESYRNGDGTVLIAHDGESVADDDDIASDTVSHFENDEMPQHDDAEPEDMQFTQLDPDLSDDEVSDSADTHVIARSPMRAKRKSNNSVQSERVTPTSKTDITHQQARRQKTTQGSINIERISAKTRDVPVDRQDGVRRGARYRYAPLEYWRGERARFGRPSLPKERESGANGDDTIDADAFENQVLPAPPPVVVLKEIIRIPRAEGEGTFSGMKLPSARSHIDKAEQRGKTGTKKPSNSKPDPRQPTRHAEDGWDKDTPTHADVMDTITGNIVSKQIACTSDQLRPRMAVGCTFGFEKVFVIEDFMATGMLFLLVDGEKPLKNSKDNFYTFTVLEGCVRVTVHETEFVIAPQGMFFIPRGNDYKITNISKRVARLSFTQAKRPNTQSQVLTSDR
jgi:mannose-6-phosphate isomerase-like protein (cupin superfamily)